MTILSNKPVNLSLIEYFKTLDVFDKRNLINELELFNSYNHSLIKKNLYFFIIWNILSFFCMLISTSYLTFYIYVIVTIFFGFIISKKFITSIKYNQVIDYLQKNM